MAEFPLPPFPYENYFFGNPFPKGGKKDLSVLQGTWYYDQYTEYEFDGKGNGCMCIDKTNHYEFTYDIDGDTLKVDYALDYVTDCKYTCSVDCDFLTESRR